MRELQIKHFEAEVKAYSAETERISKVQASMSPEQIQDIVMGTIAAAMDTGDLVSGSPQMPDMEMPQMEQMPMEQPGMEQMPQGGMQ